MIILKPWYEIREELKKHVQIVLEKITGKTSKAIPKFKMYEKVRISKH